MYGFTHINLTTTKGADPIINFTNGDSKARREVMHLRSQSRRVAGVGFEPRQHDPWVCILNHYGIVTLLPLLHF